jgi:hypothetical protein
MTFNGLSEPKIKNSHHWFNERNQEWQRCLNSRDLSLSFEERLENSRTVIDFANLPEEPEWFLRDMEYQYRKGFYHGVSEAAELIVELYRRGGYVRPQEIANIIGDWTNDLRKWKSKSYSEKPFISFGHPKMKWNQWLKVKKLVHIRDNWACVQCGSKNELEAHHVEAVKDGGLPEIENLVTLCKTCHRG